MSSRPLITSVLAASTLTLSLLAASPVKAGGVVSCENCTNPKQAAISAGVGLTLIVDVASRKLMAFDVEYDRELNRYRALSVPVQENVSANFYRLIRLFESAGREENELNGRSRRQNISIPVHPDDPAGTNGITFPEALKDLTAYDVVIGAQTRSALEFGVGRSFCAADSPSPTWNALSTTATSIVVAVLSTSFGIEGFTYVITWRDGSTSRLVITPDAVDTARYVAGSSRDAQGNRIPDAAATHPDKGGDFSGSYTFSDEHTLNEWLSAAYIYGVPVQVGDHGYPVTVVCRWDGKTLACEVPR